MMRRLLIAVLLATSASAAPAVDPALFQDLHWRLAGPFRGGRVLAVAGVPGEPQHFYFGSVNGGVWETFDAGRTWTPIFDDQPIGSIGAIAVAPSNSKILFVGTGEADMRSDIAQGDGVYRSDDGGATWTNVGLRDSQQIARIRIHPDDPDLVYVAALGHPYGPNEERGLYRTKDGGKRWEKILGPDENTGAIDVTFEPGDPEVLYAALWQTRRTPWSVYPPSNGPGSGLYKSTDGGDHWTKIDGHGFAANPGRIGLAVAPSAPNRVYAIVDAAEGGMYRSDDRGETWTHTSDDSRIWGRGWYFGGIAVEPKDADVVYSCNVVLYRSEDGGETWESNKGDNTGDDFHELWIDPDHPERRILGVDQGTLISMNGGKTWSSWYNQPTGQFYHVITDDQFPYRIYGAQQDSGAAGIPSRTNTWDGITMMQFHEVTAGGESDNIAPDPKDPHIIYGGRVQKLDTRTEQTKLIDPTLAYPDHDRRTWTLPLVFSHRDPDVLYFANQKVYRTDDGGNHWTVISDDLTREDPGAPANLDPITAALTPGSGTRHGVVYAIGPSRLADHDLWVGTDDGLIWRTKDEGGHWSNITPPELTPWSKVGNVETSHFDAETAYAAIDRHRLDDYRPYVYRTHDGGAHWNMVANGIASDSFVNVVREDPVRKGLLYAGTEKGVYVSFDDGDHWQSLQVNLPVTSVRDIDVHQNDLVIATHGRSFWVMDDVTPLRQIDGSVQKEPVWLYRPADVVRYRPAGFTGTPWPKDEPMAENPPNGAYIDYVLKSAPSGPVTLEIRDDRGNLVRRYSSADEVPVPDPKKIRPAVEWVERPSTLETTPGMHRFVWPLRYAASSGDDPWDDGVWAPPGRYELVLSADGVTRSEPLTIVPDPRVDLSPEDYRAQFELARQVEKARTEVSSALRDARKLLSELAERKANAPSGVMTYIETLERRATDISDIHLAEAGAWWIPPRHTNSLSFLSGELRTLYRAVDGADAAPGTDALASWAKLEPEVERALAAWSELKAKDLVDLENRLQAAGEPPLAPW